MGNFSLVTSFYKVWLLIQFSYKDRTIRSYIDQCTLHSYRDLFSVLIDGDQVAGLDSVTI